MTWRRRTRITQAALMGLAALGTLGSLAAPAHAGEDAELHGSLAWKKTLWLRVSAERCDELTHLVSQQLMTRVRATEEIADRRVTVFAPECTLRELREGLQAQFGLLLEGYRSSESIHFRLRPAPASKPKPKPASKRPAANKARPGAVTASAAKTLRAAPVAASAPADPRLQEKLDLSQVAVEEEFEGLPGILGYLSEGAGLCVMADHVQRAETCPGGRTVPEFVKSLDGLTLAEALDRTARAFHYTWTRSGRWFLFRAR